LLQKKAPPAALPAGLLRLKSMLWSGGSPQAAYQATVPVPAWQDAVTIRKQLMRQLLKVAQKGGREADGRRETHNAGAARTMVIQIS